MSPGKSCTTRLNKNKSVEVQARVGYTTIVTHRMVRQLALTAQPSGMYTMSPTRDKTSTGFVAGSLLGATVHEVVPEPCNINWPEWTSVDVSARSGDVPRVYM